MYYWLLVKGVSKSREDEPDDLNRHPVFEGVPKGQTEQGVEGPDDGEGGEHHQNHQNHQNQNLVHFYLL